MRLIPKMRGIVQTGAGVCCDAVVILIITTGVNENKAEEISNTHSQVCLKYCVSLNSISPDD